MTTTVIGNATLHLGDCLEVLRTLPEASVQCCVTSPPYYGLRDYGHADQIGLEQTPDDYVAKLSDVFREVRRVLKDDGTLWLNLGDSYANGGRKTRDKDDKLNQRGMSVRPDDGAKPKDLLGIPWRVAFALQADGWWLRQDIIWHKPNPMPESVQDRCTKAHEYLFLLTKSERYYFKAMQEDCIKGAAGSEFHTGKTGEHQLGRASVKPRISGNKSHKYVEAYESSDTEEHRTKSGLMKVADVPWFKRNRRSVWTIATQPYSGAHFAVMPPKLAEPCILAGSRPGDVCLDPFSGSGTVAAVATRLGRQAIGIELNHEYQALAIERIEDAQRQPDLLWRSAA